MIFSSNILTRTFDLRNASHQLALKTSEPAIMPAHVSKIVAEVSVGARASQCAVLSNHGH